jgi:sirohydrochlorin cobaltochelatase
VETLREDWPDKRVEAEKRIREYVERAKKNNGGTAIVIPFRVQGFGPYKSVLDGLEYRANGMGLIPHAEVTNWIETQISLLRRADGGP